MVKTERGKSIKGNGKGVTWGKRHKIKQSAPARTVAAVQRRHGSARPNGEPQRQPTVLAAATTQRAERSDSMAKQAHATVPASAVSAVGRGRRHRLPLQGHQQKVNGEPNTNDSPAVSIELNVRTPGLHSPPYSCCPLTSRSNEGRALGVPGRRG